MVKKPLVSKKISLVINEGVYLAVRQRPDRLSEFVQAENWIVFRDRLFLLHRHDSSQWLAAVCQGKRPARLDRPQNSNRIWYVEMVSFAATLPDIFIMLKIMFLSSVVKPMSEDHEATS